MIKFIRFHSRWFIALALLALVVVVAFRPVMSRVKVWRAGNLLDEAREHGAAGDWSEALRTSLASVQLDSTIDGLRVYFEAQRRSGDSGALRTAAALATHPEATDADRALALGAFLDFHDLVNFSNLARGLSEASREHPQVQFQVVRFLLAQGRGDEALQLADSVSAGERSAAFDLLLCQSLIRSPQVETREEAIRRLGKLFDDPDRAVALDALRILASQLDEGISEGLARKALARFGEDGELGVPEQFGLLLFKVRLDPEGKGALIEQAIRDYREAHLVNLLQWLLRVGEAEKVVELSEGEAGSLDVFRSRVKALKMLTRYEQLLEEMEDPPAGVSTVESLAVRAGLARLLERPVDESGYWRKAFDYAKLRPAQNLYPVIAEVAGEVGAVDVQMEAVASSIEHPRGIPPLAGRLAPLFKWLSENDSERLLAISRRLLQREPGNPSLINNYFYLQILHREPDAKTIEGLQQLVAAFPEALPFRGSLAFAQVRMGEATAALATLDAAEEDAADFPAGEKAVYAAALAAAGRKDEAMALQASIDWEALNEKETEVFKALIEG